MHGFCVKKLRGRRRTVMGSAGIYDVLASDYSVVGMMIRTTG